MESRASDRGPAFLHPVRYGLVASSALALCLGVSGCASTAPKVALNGCPQPRFTGQAPEDYLQSSNPLRSVASAARAGEKLFAKGAGCASCHGEKGDGRGRLAAQFDPPPRNFRCAQTVNGIPDGQLFWITRFGSPGTAMPAHPQLTDEQVWQIVAHLRRLATD